MVIYRNHILPELSLSFSICSLAENGVIVFYQIELNWQAKNIFHKNAHDFKRSFHERGGRQGEA